MPQRRRDRQPCYRHGCFRHTDQNPPDRRYRGWGALLLANRYTGGAERGPGKRGQRFDRARAPERIHCGRGYPQRVRPSRRGGGRLQRRCGLRHQHHHPVSRQFRRLGIGHRDDYRWPPTSISKTATIALTVLPGADFSLSAAQGGLSILPGMSGADIIRITSLNGFGGTVTLTASGLPTGVAATFGASGTAGVNLIVTFAVAPTAAKGTSLQSRNPQVRLGQHHTQNHLSVSLSCSRLRQAPHP